LFRNDFLENSRYAKIAYHVVATMETVNINEITNDQALAHLVKIIYSFFFYNFSSVFSFDIVNINW